jgi:hypothetical protein
VSALGVRHLIKDGGVAPAGEQNDIMGAIDNSAAGPLASFGVSLL